MLSPRYLNLVLAEEFPEPRLHEHAVIIRGPKKSRPNRQGFRVLQYLVDPAARLDRSADCKIAVPLEKKAALQHSPLMPADPLPHPRNLLERRLNQPVSGLRERRCNIRCEAPQPVLRVLNLCVRDRHRSIPERKLPVIDPHRLPQRRRISDRRNLPDKPAKSAHAVLPNAAAGASAPLLLFESSASAELSNFTLPCPISLRRRHPSVLAHIHPSGAGNCFL